MHSNNKTKTKSNTFFNKKLDFILKSICSKNSTLNLNLNQSFIQKPFIRKFKYTYKNTLKNSLKKIFNSKYNKVIFEPIKVAPDNHNKEIEELQEIEFKSKYFNIQKKSDNLILKIEHIEPIFMAVVLLIYQNFIFLDDVQKIKCLRELKKCMAIDLDEKNFYTNFNYKYKRFRKAEFQDDLIHDNININTFLYHYMADYFGINIVIKERSKITILNDYDKTRYCAFITKNEHSIEINYMLNQINLLKPEYIEKAHNTKLRKKQHFSKLKLIEIQKIALEKNILIKKKGKNGLINKTKKDLIEEINNKID